MESRIFDLKNKAVDDSGEEYLDLSQSVFAFDYSAGVKAIYRITEETVMRPDLISVKFFGTDEYMDAICKVNGVFNPFSLHLGRLIVIPKLENVSMHYKKAGKINQRVEDNNEVRNQFTDKARMSKKDEGRIKRLEEKGKTRRSPAKPLPPNVLPANKNPRKTKGGASTKNKN